VKDRGTIVLPYLKQQIIMISVYELLINLALATRVDNEVEIEIFFTVANPYTPSNVPEQLYSGGSNHSNGIEAKISQVDSLDLIFLNRQLTNHLCSARALRAPVNTSI
jgi:hypothetical protein